MPHQRLTEVKSQVLEKNPVFLITQLCWLHQVKTKEMNPFFLSPSIPFPPNRFSSIVQQFSLGINERGDRQQLSFENSEAAWTRSAEECTEM